MTPSTVVLTADVMRQAYGMFPSGVTAVCAMIDDVAAGMAASSFTSVSLDPPLVSVCMARTSTTWPRLRQSAALGISVLAAEQGEIARSLASKSGDRFANASWEVNEKGAIFLQGSPLWLECTLFDEVSAGDHEIAVFEVKSVVPYPSVAPLVFHASSFRSLSDL